MHILVAVDRSSESSNALVNALDIADAIDGQVTAVHVDPNPAADSHSDLESADPTDGQRSNVEDGEDGPLAAAEVTARSREVPIDTVRLEGDPVERIAEYAESAGVDAIYIGHRGLSNSDKDVPGEERGPLGSVSKGLVHRTAIPVTVFDRGL